MVLDTDLPENLTAVPAGHGKLQRVMVGILLGGYSNKYKHRKQKEKRRGKKRKETSHELTVGSALSLIRNLLRLKLSLRILDQLKELIFVFPWIQKNQNQLRQHKQNWKQTQNYQAVHSLPDELGGGLPQNVRNQLIDLSYQPNFKRSQHSLKMWQKKKIRAVKQRRLDLIGVSLVKRECIHCSMACFVCYVWECQVRAPLKKLPELQPSSSNHHLLIAVPNISVLSVEKTFHLELRILWY